MVTISSGVAEKISDEILSSNEEILAISIMKLKMWLEKLKLLSPSIRTVK
jgi:hypothetical protein